MKKLLVMNNVSVKIYIREVALEVQIDLFLTNHLFSQRKVVLKWKQGTAV